MVTRKADSGPADGQPLRVAITGATGMIGAGVLDACLTDDRIASIVAVGRTPTGRSHPKVADHIHRDFLEWTGAGALLGGIDACFFCLGVSSFGMAEDAYRRITKDFTLAMAGALAAARPGAVFCYVSGEGTDATERGRSMWARVKGETENALLAMDGLDPYMFRPGYVQPAPGMRSKTRLYRLTYAVLGPLYPLLRRVAPTRVTTTRNVGRAMVEVAAHGCVRRVLEIPDINRLGAQAPSGY